MTDNECIQASVGDFVEIIANTNEHKFEIGQVVTVVEWESDFGDYDDTDYGVECAPINGGNCWFVRHTDYRITAHPSEYERLREQNALVLSALEATNNMTTDNECIQAIERNIVPTCACLVCKDYKFLLQRLEQKDKTIAELETRLDACITDNTTFRRLATSLRKRRETLHVQNTLMLSALEQIRGITANEDNKLVIDVGALVWEICCDTIAQITPLTVSKQGVTTDSEATSEQPEKHALSREVAADKLWRGETT